MHRHCTQTNLHGANTTQVHGPGALLVSIFTHYKNGGRESRKFLQVVILMSAGDFYEEIAKSQINE